MDTRKLRASSNIEDQRETPAQKLGRHIGITQQVKEAMGNMGPSSSLTDMTEGPDIGPRQARKADPEEALKKTGNY